MRFDLKKNVSYALMVAKEDLETYKEVGASQGHGWIKGRIDQLQLLQMKLK